jgi:hypothetical protein
VTKTGQITGSNPEDKPTDLPATKEKDSDGKETTRGHWKSEYNRLSARYNALAENFKKAKEALQKRRDERDLWIQHAKFLEKKIRTAETEHAIHILDRDADPSKDLHKQQGRDQSIVQNSPSTPDPGTKDLHDPEPSPAALRNASSARSPAGSKTASVSSRSEQCLPILPTTEILHPVKVKEEPSSDDAVFVHERVLRKRKLDDEDGPVPARHVIKTEASDHSSSPVVASFHRDLEPQESIDLGNNSPIILTPRKHRELELSEGYREEPDETETGMKPTLDTSLVVADHSLNQAFSSALIPVHVGQRVSLKAVQEELRDKPLKKGLSRGIAVLAEDGNTYQKITQGSPLVLKTVRPVAKGRLDALLNGPAVDEQVDVHRATPKGLSRRQTPVTPQTDIGLPKPRALPFDQNSRLLVGRTDTPCGQISRPPLADTTNTVQNGAQSVPYKKPRRLLRNKPLSELRLDDFKVNPSVNDGHDFAFSEVVRNKDDRACLPGCVDMHCCGKHFRALALSQRPNSPLTPAQRQEEQQLLEGYLGDFAYRLASMSKEERAEIWVEAKTRELANKYGKHRHRFSRMRSPPGFWNADFPSTQELDADRAEAGKRENELIQDRYREAMRSGGRWLFRDE